MIKPQAVFDQASFLSEHKKTLPYFVTNMSQELQAEYQICASFLLCYQGSSDTFKAYRREIERLYQWCLTQDPCKKISQLNREDIQAYIRFIKDPPKSWCSKHHMPRFIGSSHRTPNPKWRPFILKNNKMSNASISAMLAILSTFYTYLQQEQICALNPIRMLRQKKRLVQQNQQKARITRKLSSIQWQAVINCVKLSCVMEPEQERSLFVLSILYLLSLRISEIAQNELHTPVMGDFFRDANDCWWFKTIGKGNKYREIAVPDSMLEALKRFRISLGLTDLPYKNEDLPLIPKIKGSGSVGIRQIRKITQACFDQAVIELKAKGLEQEAQDLNVATVHWLRHTSITADVQNRPIEHVRDDAGHNHASITDRYIDSDQRARHESARSKKLIEEQE